MAKLHVESLHHEIHCYLLYCKRYHFFTANCIRICQKYLDDDKQKRQWNAILKTVECNF